MLRHLLIFYCVSYFLHKFIILFFYILFIIKNYKLNESELNIFRQMREINVACEREKYIKVV